MINKTLIVPKELTTYELVKGRALALKIKWRESEETILINVYTPNNRNNPCQQLAHLKKARAKRLQRQIKSNTSIPGGNPGWDMVSNKQRKEAQRHPLSPKDP